MVLLFALVEWKDDPKPDCWQVIKTRQIQANPSDIFEGKCVDALWKSDEETSVAEVLKLSGECAFTCYNNMNTSLIRYCTKTVELFEIMFFFSLIIQTVERT